MSFSVYCDGGSRGNPGPAAIGFVAFENSKQIKKFSKTIGRATNNVAEYRAVIAALKWVKGLDFPTKNALVNFYLDSQLVVNQLRGIYKVKDQKLKKLAVLAKSLEREIGVKIFYHLIRREKNKIADSLVNKAFSSKN